MQTAAVLDILVKANTRPATAGLKNTNDQLQKVDRQTKRTEGRMTAMSRAGNRSFSLLATGAKAGGLAIGAGLVVGLKKANDEAREAAKVSRLTDAALRSTGGAANVSKKQIESLAQAISQKAGVDDEAVQSSQNLLLTFTKIRNETGKGNKIFTQASHTVADFSARFGKDLNSSAILVGKALNDPIKGVTALTRVGVQFTEQQKSQIATMVESGNMLGAQKVILGELGTQTRGAAAASADGMDKFKVAVNNVFEVVGGPLTSALNAGAGALGTFLTQVQSGTGAGGRFRTSFVTAFNDVRTTLASFIASLNISRADIQNFGQAATNVFNAIRGVARAVWPGVSQAVRGALNNMMGFVRIWTGLLTLNFRQVWKGVKQITMGAINGLIGLIRASPLGVAAKFAFDKVRQPAVNAFNAVKSTVTSVFNGIKKIMGDVIAGILRRFADLFDIAAKIPGIGSRFKGLADRARESATQIDKVGESVRNVPSKKDVRVNVGVKWPPALKKAFPAFGGGGKGDGWPLDQAIGAVAKKGAQATVDKLRPEDLTQGVIGGSPFGPLGKTRGKLGKLKSISASMGLSAGRGPGQGFRPGDDGYHGVGRAFDSSGSAPQMMAFARHMAKKFGGSLLELIYTPLGFSIKNGRKVPPYAQADHFDHVHVAAQRGSMVPGSGSGDKVRALLEPGEGIINKKAVAAMGGAGAIHAINSMVPRFQAGGMARQDPRAKEMGFLQGVWGRVAPLLGQNPNRKLPTLFKHMRLDASNTHSAAVTWDKGTWNNRKGTPSLTWASSLYSGKNKLSQLQRTQLFIHEMAHRFQNKKKTGAAWWLSEGGAEAFSQHGMRQLGLPVQASGSKYGAYANRVIAEKGWDWVQKGQFMQRGGIALDSAVPRFASGGVVAQAAKAAGFRGANLLRAVAEAKGESGWNERAVGDGGQSKGLMQIHTGFNPWAARLNLFNPRVNMQAAMRIFRSQGWGAWYGNHVPHIGAARAAIASLGKGGAGKPSKKPGGKPVPATKGRSGLSYQDRVALADEGIAKAERTSNLKPIGRMDDIRATKNKMRLLRGRKKKIGTRLRKINKALKGKLKPATRKRLLDERSQLLADRGSITTELGTLTGNLQGFKTGETTEAGPTADEGEGTNPLEEAMRAQTEALQAHTQAILDQAAEARALTAEMAKQNAFAASVSAITGREGLRAFSDVISRQLGGNAAQRGLTAGDGETKARY